MLIMHNYSGIKNLMINLNMIEMIPMIKTIGHVKAMNGMINMSSELYLTLFLVNHLKWMLSSRKSIGVSITPMR